MSFRAYEEQGSARTRNISWSNFPRNTCPGARGLVWKVREGHFQPTVTGLTDVDCQSVRYEETKLDSSACKEERSSDADVLVVAVAEEGEAGRGDGIADQTRSRDTFPTLSTR